MPSIERITRVPNSEYQPSGVRSYLHALNKYKFKTTLEGPYFLDKERTYGGRFPRLNRLIRRKAITRYVVKKRLDGGKTGEVPSEDQMQDVEYLSPVTIGTPGQTFNLDFDTGSADLWIFSTELPSDQQTSNGQKHTLFDPKGSSSYKTTDGATWSISYGDGSGASGDVGTDTVTIGGIAITEQTIELAKQLSAQFSQGPGDGLLGLAFDSINTVTPNKAKTPVTNMIAQGNNNDGVFTAYLSSWRDTSAADKGESFYTFGYIDQDVLKAQGATEPHYAPVDNSQGFWMFPSATVCINGKSTARSGNTAIADTGTTLALVDDDTCKAIYGAIKGAKYDSQNQGWVIPSDTKPADLPTVAFAVGDQEFTIPKEAIAFADVGNGTIYGGVQSRGTLPFDILGDTFLKGIYAVFDAKQTRFGAVQRKDETGDTLAPGKTTQ